MMNATDNKLKYTADAVNDIEAAIKEKGVDVQPTDALDTYAAKIRSIKSGGDLDFTEIGYGGAPQYLKEGLAYAEKIQNEWDENQTDLTYKFKDDKKLLFFPLVNLGKCKYANYAFIRSGIFFLPKLDTSNIINATNMFYGCAYLKDYFPLNLLNCNNVCEMFANSSITELKIYNTQKIIDMSSFCPYSKIIEIPNLDIPNCTTLRSAFRNTPQLKKVGILNTPKVTNFYELFWQSNVEIIEGLDFSSAENISDAFNAPIKFMTIRNLGKSELTNYSFTQMQGDSWGDESTGIVGARQSLVDSLLTYSYDRKANGLPVATITLRNDAKARLTQDEITQITNKGYTIA